MKRLKIKKMATLLAVAMLLSLVMPIVAAAAPVIFFGDANGVKHTWQNKAISYSNNGNVEGFLLSSDPLHTVTEHVYVAASLDPYALLKFNSIVKAVYDGSITVGEDTYYRYHFGGAGNRFTVTESTYNPIFMSYLYEATNELVVSDAVYRSAPTSKDKRRIPFGVLPPSGIDSECAINLGNRSEVTAFDLNSTNCDTGDFIVTSNSDYVILSAKALADLAESDANAVVNIVTPNGTYALPVAALDYDALANSLNTTLSNLKIRVEIKSVSGDVANAIEEQARAQGLQLVADAVEFAVVAVAPGGTKEITSFGNTYVERTIALQRSVNPNTSTAAVYNPESGTFSFVPSVFWEDNGDAYVTLKRNSNSIYTAVAQDKTFSDVPAGHWAEEDIHTLANKLVVHGVSEDQFDLRRNVTRAEFAGLVVRSLGLGGSEGSHSFSDIPANAWYAEEVAIATEAGLIYGYEDGTFRPNEVITREELASLVVRALEYAGFAEELSASEQSALLAPFNDADQVGGWAREELARAIKEEIVFGVSEDTLNPKGNATRAEAVAMLYRYLQAADFIN